MGNEARRRLIEALHVYLKELGVDLDAPSMRETPERWVSVIEEYTEGLRKEFNQWKVFDSEESSVSINDGMIIIHNIPFSSICEHHLLPFFGRIHIAYLPGTEIVGISKFSRLVSWLAARPQLQERLTSQIADHVMKLTDARGVFVLAEAIHTCMITRGARSHGASIVTMSSRGEFKEEDVRMLSSMLLGRGSLNI